MIRPSLAAVFLLAMTGRAASAQDACLQYVARYADKPNLLRHLVGVENVFGQYALMTAHNRIDVIDLETLTPEDDVIEPISSASINDAYSTVTRADGWVYANLRVRGFAILRLDPASLTLTLQSEITEPGVIYDDPTLAGDRLYVPAHSYGIRIFDLTDPAAPVLIGSLEDGFDDAFRIAVEGTTAYVADGAGGLKIVDLSDESQPVIVDGENPQTALGTAEDVLVHNGHVYVACGGAGVAIYEPGGMSTPLVFDTPICAKGLTIVGDHLAVADIGGLELFTIAPDGGLIPNVHERSTRRWWDGGADVVRLWHGVSAWGDDRILAANWAYVDVFEIVDPADATEPDITASSQRLRFSPSGGMKTVQLSNDGCDPLVVQQIWSTAATFTVSPSSVTIQPGEAIDLTIAYAGGQPGTALVLANSNDPDESPLPIQVYGATPYLDPGEQAIGFTVESWTYDHDAGEFVQGIFDLDAHAGQLVYFHVFATW